MARVALFAQPLFHALDSWQHVLNQRLSLRQWFLLHTDLLSLDSMFFANFFLRPAFPLSNAMGFDRSVGDLSSYAIGIFSRSLI